MKKRITPVTFHYLLITGGFWMSFCIISSYAAVYLQGIGYNNQELGIIMALVMAWFMKKTRKALSLSAVGESPATADAACPAGSH